MLKPISLIFLFLISVMITAVAAYGAVANEPAPYSTYGQLMIEDETANFSRPLAVSLSSGYDVTNPYLNTFNINGTVAWEFHPLFAVGVEALGFISDSSRYNRTLQNDLSVFGVTANEDRPQFASFLILKTKVLSGRVNVFGRGALPFQFNVKLGTGMMWLNSDMWAVGASTWGLEPQMGLSERWAVSLRFDQDIQGFASRSPAIYRNRIGVGAQYAF